MSATMIMAVGGCLIGIGATAIACCFVLRSYDAEREKLLREIAVLRRRMDDRAYLEAIE